MKLRQIQPARWIASTAATACMALFCVPASAAEDRPAIAPAQLTYADLADLADSARMVVKAGIRKQRPLAPEQSPGLRAGWVRLLIEADTEALIAGHAPIGQSLRFLADFPLDAKGKPPKLKKAELVLFALPAANRPADLQLIDVDSYVAADPALEARLREVLVQLAAPEAPPKVTGVRDALAVEGNLSGESETQLFLAAAHDAPVSLSVQRRPNMAPEWGVSWSELVDQSARPPQKDTLEWYRLACFLPRQLPPEAILSASGSARVLAASDYRYVLDQLGTCARTRGGPPKF
ncbi:MAG: hypothetical protein P0Y56_11535 [Candidatus Andeanibacterium colombiense]|uniref:Uncharacterized protein n=1 Tax=Candidatus Andeanibacterium colombiense TaxID=3121345 RepID=A0AAJ5X122_9SPHN|nr:MAG: hypothetical protein P0Y56_11535 [Sphingomonadaceae bacterium]